MANKWILLFPLLLSVHCGGPPGIPLIPFDDDEILDLDEVSKASLSKQTDRICWGDLHGHSTVSDGNLSPQNYFLTARKESNLDFVAVTDHIFAHPFKYGAIKKQDWINLLKIATFYHQPGKLITFAGFEWTTNGGHFVAYFPDNNPSIFEKDFPETINEVAQWVEKAGGLLHVAHPVTRPGVFEPTLREFRHLPNIINAEISGYEGLIFEEGYRQFLAKGMKLGVIGVSDTHEGPPGKGGLTAVWVSACTQEEILDALRNRRNFASTGERIELDFKADGHWMGEEYTPTTPPLFKVKISASTELESILLFKDEDLLFVTTPLATSADMEYRDEEWSRETAHYYRVEVVMKNSHRIWSSPIWTNSTP